MSPIPQTKRFKICFKSLLVYSSAKDNLKSAKKRDIFLILHFGRQPNGGGGNSWLCYCLNFHCQAFLTLKAGTGKFFRF